MSCRTVDCATKALRLNDIHVSRDSFEVTKSYLENKNYYIVTNVCVYAGYILNCHIVIPVCIGIPIYNPMWQWFPIYGSFGFLFGSLANF